MGVRFRYRILIWCFLLLSTHLLAQTTEYELKAVFLGKFARYTHWPENSLTDTFNLGILGGDPFHGELNALYKNVTIKNLPVRLHYLSSIEGIPEMDMLFLVESLDIPIEDILTQINKQPILIVSDRESDYKKGTHISFYITRNKTIIFDINERMLAESALKMDFILLNVARNVLR